MNHSAGKYVKDGNEDVHTNSAESFFSMLDRGLVKIYHKMSPKHMDRYAKEFAGRHNDRQTTPPRRWRTWFAGCWGIGSHTTV